MLYSSTKIETGLKELHQLFTTLLNIVSIEQNHWSDWDSLIEGVLILEEQVIKFQFPFDNSITMIFNLTNTDQSKVSQAHFF